MTNNENNDKEKLDNIKTNEIKNIYIENRNEIKRLKIEIIELKNENLNLRKKILSMNSLNTELQIAKERIKELNDQIEQLLNEKI